MEHEILTNDIKLCESRNKDRNYKKIDLVMYKPDRLVISTLDFDPDKIRLNRQMGMTAKPVQL